MTRISIQFVDGQKAIYHAHQWDVRDGVVRLVIAQDAQQRASETVVIPLARIDTLVALHQEPTELSRSPGQGLAEYALALALIALVVAGVVALWGGQVLAAFEMIR